MPYINDIDVPADGNCLYSAVLIALMNERLLDEENSNSLAAVAQEKLFADIKTKIRSQKGYETFGESAICFKEWYPELLTYSNSYQLLEEIMVPILRGAIADYALGLNEEEEVYQELSDKISLVNLNENVSAKSAAELSDNYQPEALTAEEYKIHFEEVRDKDNAHHYGSIVEFSVIEKIYGVTIKSIKDQNPQSSTLYIHNESEHYHASLRVRQEDIGANQVGLKTFCEKANADRVQLSADNFDVDFFVTAVQEATQSFKGETSIDNVLQKIDEISTLLPVTIFKLFHSEKKDKASLALSNFWHAAGARFLLPVIISKLSKLREAYQIMPHYNSLFVSSPKKIMTARSKSKSEALENYERCCGDVRDFIANNSDANIDGVLNSVLGAFDNLSLQEKDDNPLLRASNIWLGCAMSKDKIGFANAIQKFQEDLVAHLPDDENNVSLPIASPVKLVIATNLSAALPGRLRVEINNQIKVYEKGNFLKKKKGQFLQTLLSAIDNPPKGCNTFLLIIESVVNQKDTGGKEKWPRSVDGPGCISSTVKNFLERILALDKATLLNNCHATFQPVNSRSNPGSAVPQARR